MKKFQQEEENYSKFCIESAGFGVRCEIINFFNSCLANYDRRSRDTWKKYV